jgi:hypothetical protein
MDSGTNRLTKRVVRTVLLFSFKLPVVQQRRLTSTFSFQLEPVWSNGRDFAVALDLDTIALELALCIFSQIPEQSAKTLHSR